MKKIFIPLDFLESQRTVEFRNKLTWNFSPIPEYLFVVCAILWTARVTDATAGVLNYAIMCFEPTFCLQSQSYHISIILNAHFPHSTAPLKHSVSSIDGNVFFSLSQQCTK